MLVPLLLLQIQVTAFTTPPGGDTTGYWQQRVRYDVVVRLEEERATLVGRGTMRYVNNSPDTLRELYFHQHLNAFRPGSRWSAADERENRERFQRLEDPHHAFERFTAAPRVNGQEVRAEYPFAPDSTVVRMALPRPLAPADSLEVAFEWEARPSTLPRRQGRRGRQYDFAHWYPRIAVYDRGGWQYNPLVPAGEFYGEFGTYDVTMVLRGDQIVGATGVPVEGDPGWDTARVWGTAYPLAQHYGEVRPRRVGEVTVPPGYRLVRFHARDVHHFGWSVNPSYRYEGGLYDGRVAIHVLYRPGSADAWGEGQAAQRTARALEFLEEAFGTYVYPQVTNLNRLDGGGTEFPMMMMNFSASQGLILHELAHIYVHGILANNEWRHAWLDEGLASYLTLWGQGMTPYERAIGMGLELAEPTGYRARAVRPYQVDAGDIRQFRHDLRGRAEPMATLAHEFSEFGIYNAMSYGRAELMWGALRDVMGDSTFVAFLREMYARWHLKHVDELAVRTVASDVHGSDLGWFFDQWLHRTGLVDYTLRSVQLRAEGDGWVTRARVSRRGEYRHPIPVGARMDTVWVIGRADPFTDDQWVEIRTPERPDEIRLDPYGVVPDWDRRNDVSRRWGGGGRGDQTMLDWPFLRHSSRDRNVTAVAPFGWFTDPGGIALGVRSRRSFQEWIDQAEIGVTVALRHPERESEGRAEWVNRLNTWVRWENPRLPGARRPLVGWRLDAWNVDGLTLLGVRRRWDLSRLYIAPGMRRMLDVSFTATGVQDSLWADPARWGDAVVSDLSAEMRWEPDRVRALGGRVMLTGGYVARSRTEPAVVIDGAVAPPPVRGGGFWRAEAEARRRFELGDGGRTAARARVFAGASDRAAPQRSLGLSALDPTQTFGQHLYRGAGAPLARASVHYVPLGGAGLRAYSSLLRPDRVAAANVELERLLYVPAAHLPSLWFTAFGDIAHARFNWLSAAGTMTMGDAGIGLAIRGNLYDVPIALRFDVPFYVSHAALAAGGSSAHGRMRPRWVVAFGELWQD